MKNYSILPLLVAALAGLLCSCASSVDIDHLQPGHPLPFEAEGYIQLSGGECLGPCPAYDLFIFSSGHVIYRGRYYTMLKGMRYTRAPKARYAELLQTLESKQAFAIPGGNGECITDGPAFQLTARAGDVSRTRVVDSGCMEDREMWKVVESIPRIARVDRWVHRDNLGW